MSSGIYGYGGDSGLNFTGKVENYTVTYPKSGLMLVTFVTRSREDRYHYQVEVTTGGSAAITVIGDDHQSIDFEGNRHGVQLFDAQGRRYEIQRDTDGDGTMDTIETYAEGDAQPQRIQKVSKPTSTP